MVERGGEGCTEPVPELKVFALREMSGLDLNFKSLENNLAYKTKRVFREMPRCGTRRFQSAPFPCADFPL